MDLSRKRVLVVDDHPGMLNTMRRALEMCGISGAHMVRSAQEAVARLRNMRYDIVLADYDLGPGPDGQQLLEHCRAERLLAPAAIFVMVTAERAYDRVMSAAEAVPDDYLVKPFSFTEMMARIRVAMRHRHFEENPAPKVYRASGIEIDVQRHQVIRHGERVRLTPTEFKLLERLMLQSGQVVTHRQLLADVWGAEFVEHTHYLRLYMAQLRNKLEEVPAQPKLLITEPGIGYRLSEAEPN